MKQYIDLCKDILENGTRQANRTGIDAISLPGAMMKFHMRDGFPAPTTKRLAFKASKGETLSFLRGYENAADFRRMGCKFWDGNANHDGIDSAGNAVPNKWLTNPNRKGEDDLGRIYGAQWRDWRCYAPRDGVPNMRQATQYEQIVRVKSLDQVQHALDTVRNDPTNRRIIINAWRPDEFDQMALPPCHVLSQLIVNVEKKELNLCYYQRSCDVALGVPMNITSYALLLHIYAMATGYKPGTLTAFMADTHIYINHVDGIKEQMAREPYVLPQLAYSGPDVYDLYSEYGAQAFNYVDPDYFTLVNYEHHDPIAFEMAV